MVKKEEKKEKEPEEEKPETKSDIGISINGSKNNDTISRQVQIQKTDIQVCISSEDPKEDIGFLMDMALYVLDEYGNTNGGEV